jgi:ribosomal protein S19
MFIYYRDFTLLWAKFQENERIKNKTITKHIRDTQLLALLLTLVIHVHNQLYLNALGIVRMANNVVGSVPLDKL